MGCGGAQRDVPRSMATPGGRGGCSQSMAIPGFGHCFLPWICALLGVKALGVRRGIQDDSHNHSQVKPKGTPGETSGSDLPCQNL